jgi:hypothetical protein
MPEIIAHDNRGCASVNVEIIKIPIKPTMPNKRPTPEMRRVMTGIMRKIPINIRKVAVSTFF